MKRIILIVALLMMPALWLARGAAPAAAGQGGEDQPAVRFMPVDVVLDTGAKHLGAYQVEITAKNATIVGLEGGESKAFQDAYYDPAALQGNRIVVAAFSTADALPAGASRVARLHLMVTGNIDPAKGMPEMASKLVVATDAAGKEIDAKLILRPNQGEKP